MTPHGGDTIFCSSSQQLVFEGFGLTWRPSRALDSPHALLPELQSYRDTARCAALGAEVLGYGQQQLMKHTFLHQSLILKCRHNRIELVTRPAPPQVTRAMLRPPECRPASGPSHPNLTPAAVIWCASHGEAIPGKTTTRTKWPRQILTTSSTKKTRATTAPAQRGRTEGNKHSNVLWHRWIGR